MSGISYSGYSGGILGGTDYQYGGFGYGVGICMGILLIITTITCASYYCTRKELAPPAATLNVRIPAAAAVAGPEHDVAVDVGLDDATIKSYPKLLYSEVKLQRNSDGHRTAAGCCSICLADYSGNDELRQLPDCGHLFHSKCIDTWLRLHPTCPFCRTTPLPTPIATPLAEVAPLVSGRGRGSTGGGN